MIDNLFIKYQKPLVKLANRSDGRKFLGIDKDKEQKGKWITRVFHNGYEFLTGRDVKVDGVYRPQLQAVLRCYPLIYKRIAISLNNLKMLENIKLESVWDAKRRRAIMVRSRKPYANLPKFNGLLHYAGLRNDNRFPQVMMAASGDPIYSQAGDGYVSKSNSASWDTTHDATSGQSATYATSAADYGVVGNDGSNVYMARGFTPFDSSVIGAGNTVSTANVQVYAVALYTADNDGDDWINIVQSAQAATNQLVVGDFNDCGAVNDPTEGSTRKDLSTDITTSAYNSWVLNATGLSWIDVEGNTLIGWREGHDALDNPYAGASSNYSGMNGRTSEQADTTQDPKLVPTYTAAGGGDDTHGYFNV